MRTTGVGNSSCRGLPSSQVALFKDYVARIFETPGVQAILKRDLSRLDIERDAILSHQGWVALYGEPAQFIRAADLIAKVCSWY